MQTVENYPVGTIFYFGTGINRPGHYFWRLYPDRMEWIRQDLVVPFNPEKMPRYENSEQRKLGDVRFYCENGYSIIAIEGSCGDKRQGSKSVFFVKENLSAGQLLVKLQAIPMAMKMFAAMPFQILWLDYTQLGK